MSTIAVAPV